MAFAETAAPVPVTKEERKEMKEEKKEERKEAREEKKEERKETKKLRRELTDTERACMQAAVEKRDNSIIAAADKYHSELVKALQTRRDAIKAAWGLKDPTERQKALKAAWDAYHLAKKQIVKGWREARKAAWRQYYADRKACGEHAAVQDKGAEGSDADL
ncbi:MAG: hypothetical protein G01um101419_555 [Parcubacteria group bacterium Gr01-1014_19]|nr:MAG: hypothetical protein G01um101419_555 [Parcubacteria group bacterium Gr01-1014_19]